MTLLEFIHDLPAIKDEARNLWGEDVGCTCGLAPNISVNWGIAIGATPGVHRPHDGSCPYNPMGYLDHLEKLIRSDNPLQYYKDNQPSKEKK